MFCYAYYSHSFEHESEFQHSKLGSLLNPSSLTLFSSLELCFQVSMHSCLVVNGMLPNTRAMWVWSQGNLYGGVTRICLLLRTM